MSSQAEVPVASTGIPFRALEFRDARLYIVSAAFISLGVLVPWLTHHFGGVQAGSMFLPMFFFVLLAGLSGGWRAGLLVGLCTPLISFGVSGMPAAATALNVGKWTGVGLGLLAGAGMFGAAMLARARMIEKKKEESAET